VLLCLVWLLPGLVGHAPWKGGDGSNFVRFLELWQHGDWVAHGLAYDAYPPLYYWVAAATAWLTSPILALHDGARLASGVFIALALFFSARAAQKLYGEDHRWAAVLAMLGSVGLLLRAHEMNAYTAQLAGVAIVLDGLARLPKDARGGWIVAAGLGIMLLATGLMEPLALALLAGSLPVFIPAYRSEQAKRGLLLGLLSATALCLAWIILLWYRQEPLLQVLQLQRWLAWAQTASQLKPLTVLGLLPWYVWPSWPLAGWALYQTRRRWREPATLMPLLVLLVLFIVFSLSLNSGEAKILAIIAPTALLAAAGLMSLRRGAANAFLWFSVMLFAFLGIVFWVYWSAHDLATPARLAKRLVKLGAENIGDLRVIPLLIGIVATVSWLVFIARVPRSPLRPILVWSAGISFVWVLLLGLFLSVFDPRLGYTRVAEVLSKQIPHGECVNTRNVGSQQRVLLAYHSGLDLRASATADCGWLLVQGKRRESPGAIEPGWELRQQTRRAGDRADLFSLYARRR
jgi:4-amino-4-deoxy-L-arabinose transferase-like glycosyltransferase